MPTYEYQCQSCGHILETFQSISADPLTECPKCQDKNGLARILFSAPSFQLKGTGWYKTDYKKPQAEQATSSDQDQTKDKPDTKTTDTGTQGKESKTEKATEKGAE